MVCPRRLGRVEEARSALARLRCEAPTMREAQVLEQTPGGAPDGPTPATWDAPLDLR